MNGPRVQVMEIRGVEDDEEANVSAFDGYLSRWGEEDSYGDIVERGAFKDDLKARGAERPLLWQHDYMQPIGILEAREDDEGLRIQGQINLDVRAGREARSLLKQGAVKGLSQGFETLDFKPRKQGHGRHLTQIKLWEGSLVTFPALASAQVDAVKACDAALMLRHGVALPSVLQAVEARRVEHEARGAEEIRGLTQRLEKLSW